MLRRPLLALLLAAVLAPATAHAWSWGDTLTVIMKPIPNIPSIVAVDDTLTVWARAPIGASGWSGKLLAYDQEVLLAPLSSAWMPSLDRWVIHFLVPEPVAASHPDRLLPPGEPGYLIPEDVYDLVLTSTATPPDTARHAVKVIHSFPKDFYFAQISDTHLPMHPFSSDGGWNANDTTAMADFNAVIDDLNLIRPAFVLHTGDLVNEGELEDYLGVYEMSRANAMLSRLRDPIFVVTGNHDIGGWDATAPPDGTARKNWWRQFGWPWLLDPPAGDPHHSQDYSFDYGNLHVIGMETYINNGSYDNYRQDIWGPLSFTTEQLNWLAADVAAVPAGHKKIAFYHYDFGGAAFSPQMTNPAARGLDGVLWGHNHGVAEGNRSAVPFNLGLQSVIDGRRTFRIFRFNNGVITPGPMHKAGTTTDSLATTWSAPNNGTRSLLTATINNRYGEAWDKAQPIFLMADHDSSFIVSGSGGGGSAQAVIAQVVRGGGIARVYVNCLLRASTITAITVQSSQPLVGVEPSRLAGIALAAPVPNPLARGEARFAFTLDDPDRASLALFDVTGRQVATLFEGEAAAGRHEVSWDARGPGGVRVAPGVYLVRLAVGRSVITRRIAVVR